MIGKTDVSQRLRLAAQAIGGTRCTSCAPLPKFYNIFVVLLGAELPSLLMGGCNRGEALAR